MVILLLAGKFTAEQLCWKSSRKGLSIGIPEFVFADHDVDDGQQFSHTGNKGHFLKLALGQQALVERFDSRIATNGSQCGHVKLAAYLGATPIDVTRTTLIAAVTIEGCHAGELRDLMAIKLAQLGTVSEQ